jgi:hypothetical protein
VYLRKMKWCPKCRTRKRLDYFYVDISCTAKNKRNGYCKACRKIGAKAYRIKHRERICAWMRRYHAINPTKRKHANLMQSYGISLEKFYEMVKRQKSRCAICGTHESKCPKGRSKRIRLHVDHDHRTGIMRALLCHHCNHRLDVLATPKLLRKSAEYLESFARKDG